MSYGAASKDSYEPLSVDGSIFSRIQASGIFYVPYTHFEFFSG